MVIKLITHADDCGGDVNDGCQIRHSVDIVAKFYYVSVMKLMTPADNCGGDVNDRCQIRHSFDLLSLTL